ncbi:hypothetical protein JCM10449v2_000313 [Rhodotorula kratochvilovae]
MRVSSAIQPALWLFTSSSLLSYALAVPSTPVNALRDALKTAALPPALAADIPPVDPESWALLLEHARKVVESEARAPQGVEGVHVVRETFFVPMGAKVGEPRASTGAAVLPGVGAAVQEVKEQVEAADIVKTVGKLRVLRPVFTYAIHHPLRFLYSYALLPLLSLVLSFLLFLLRTLGTLLSLPLSPLSFLLSTLLLSPLAATTAVLAALTPLWYTLAAALACGAGCGALAGLIAGRSTRTALEDAVCVTRRAGRWLGLLPKETPLVPRRKPGGFGAGATLERFAPSTATTTTTEASYSSASPVRGLSATQRGKLRAFDDSEDASSSGDGLYGGGTRPEESPSDEEEDVSEEWESGTDPLASEKVPALAAGGSAAGWRGRKVAW